MKKLLSIVATSTLLFTGISVPATTEAYAATSKPAYVTDNGEFYQTYFASNYMGLLYVDNKRLFTNSPVHYLPPNDFDLVPEGGTFISLKTLRDDFGVKVSWFNNYKSFNLEKDGKKVGMSINYRKAIVNGQTINC